MNGSLSIEISQPSIVLQEGVTQPSPLYKQRLASVMHKAEAIARYAFLALKAVCLDPNAFASVCRKLEAQVIPFAEEKNGCSLTVLRTWLKSSLSIINTLQIADHFDYIINARYHQDATLVIAGKAALGMAQAGEVVQWLKEMGFIAQSKASLSLGKLKIFGNTTLQGIISRAWFLAYALFALDALERLRQPGSTVHKAQAGLDFLNYAAEAGLSAMVLANVANLTVLGVMAAVCIGFGIISLFHRELHKSEPKQ